MTKHTLEYRTRRRLSRRRRKYKQMIKRLEEIAKRINSNIKSIKVTKWIKTN